jgi:hypothetical protein
MYGFNASLASSLTGFPTVVGWAHARVGPGEYERYGNVTVDPGAEPWLSGAFSRGSVRIYAVDHAELPAIGGTRRE